MGQKVNPHGLRVGIIKDWDSKWYADTKDGEFSDNLVEDYKIREFLKKELYSANISKIEIERTADKVRVNLYTAKPGVVIGKGGAGINEIKAKLQKLTSKKLFIDIKEIKKPDLDAQLVAENIAQQLENRISFRRAMKSCMSRTMKMGALGIKACCSGRLGGADMAIQRVRFLFRLFVLTSIMVLLRQTQLMVKLVLRYGFTTVKYFLLKETRKGAINNVNA